MRELLVLNLRKCQILTWLSGDDLAFGGRNRSKENKNSSAWKETRRETRAVLGFDVKRNKECALIGNKSLL